MTSFRLCGSSVKINLDNSLGIGSEGVGNKQKKLLCFFGLVCDEDIKIGQMKKSRFED